MMGHWPEKLPGIVVSCGLECRQGAFETYRQAGMLETAARLENS
jgi:hypothetical protein